MLESRRLAGAALLLLPAGLMAFFAFNSGGFYPGPPAYAAVALCLVLVLRVTMAEDPLAGAGVTLALVATALALYALLTLLSQIWSHAPGTALVEFDRVLVYLLVLVLFGSLRHSPERLRWMLRILAAVIVIVCACGLITRLLPHVWPTTPELQNDRLSFPLTYWNALGLFGAFGVVLCLHLSSDAREPIAVRILAAAAIPMLATTIYFTFSRGGILAALIAVVLYVLIGRPRALVSTALAVIVPAAIALKFAYDANLLATQTPASAGAVGQGKHVAVAVIACAAGAAVLRAILAGLLDPRLLRFSLPEHVRPRVQRAAWAILAAATVIAIIALSGTISHDYHRFLSPALPGNQADLRTRLSSPVNDGRIELWKVAWEQFKLAPVLGHGAGTFANTWARFRTTQQFVTDAHSLYLQTLDELGLVGLVLLLGVIVAILVRTALRARGPARPLYAAAFAILVAWALHTSVDWDWKMPVVTLPFFALGGFMLSRPLPGASVIQPARRVPFVATRYGRTLAGIGCLLLAVAPAYMWLSQRRLDQASAAFAHGNCQAATQSALSSITLVGDRPQPYEVVAYCDIRRDMPNLAIAAIQKAISLDPENWNYRYDLAVVQAASGRNPLPAARKAVSLDPREPLVQTALQTFRDDRPRQWARDGQRIARAFTTL